jgi:hypothetical protein
MRLYLLAVAVILGAAVCGCSESDKASTLTPPPPQQNDKALFEMQLQSLNKARGVEGTLQLDAQHLNEAVDKQEAPSH